MSNIAHFCIADRDITRSSGEKANGARSVLRIYLEELW